MQVFAHLPLEGHVNRWGHLRRKYESGKFEVVKLFGPVYGSTEQNERGRSYVYAHVQVPVNVSDRVEGWRIQADGSCRISVDVGPNYEVLAPFLARFADGEAEIDVRDAA